MTYYFIQGCETLGNMPHYCILLGSVLGLFSVLAGAGGVHALADVLDAESLSTFQTAARFQMYHAIVLLFLGFLHYKKQSKALTMAALFLIFGICLFSGSLYVLALTGIGILGMITPLGGLVLILGWACLVVGALTITKTFGPSTE